MRITVTHNADIVIDDSSNVGAGLPLEPRAPTFDMAFYYALPLATSILIHVILNLLPAFSDHNQPSVWFPLFVRDATIVVRQLPRLNGEVVRINVLHDQRLLPMAINQ